ncbi:MAG: hypothetical protein AB7I30_20655 [Isosphaeraceae bacterium]
MLPGRITPILVLTILALDLSHARADLVIKSQFNPGQGTLVSMGFDVASDSLWIYDSSGAQLRNHSRSGVFLGGIARPGESANDFDLTFAPNALTLGATPVGAGTLLAINGESGPAEIYAVNKSDGSVLATLNTAFGASHVVGGAYHAGRNTFFLVQDRQPSNPALRSLIAEIDPLTGSVLNTFGTTSVDYTINFGDLEISAVTGNLLLVSSDETRIRELTPSGVFVRDLNLPVGVGPLSGLALDEARGEAWVSSTNGVVYQLGGLTPSAIPEPHPVLLGFIATACVAVLRHPWNRNRSRS